MQVFFVPRVCSFLVGNKCFDKHSSFYYSICRLVVAWVKDTTFQVTDLAFSTFANIFSNKFLATFHLYANFPLYKSAVFNREVFVAVSCVPLTCSREEQEDLRTRPMHDGKFHVRSQPSLEKVYDSEKALVTVTGPFQNGHVDTGKRMIR